MSASGPEVTAVAATVERRDLPTWAGADAQAPLLDELMGELLGSEPGAWSDSVARTALHALPEAAMAAVVVRDDADEARVDAVCGEGTEAWAGERLTGIDSVLAPVLVSGTAAVGHRLRPRAAGSSLALSVAAGLPIALRGARRGALLVGCGRGESRPGTLALAPLERLVARAEFSLQCVEALERRSERRLQDERLRIAVNAEQRVIAPLARLVDDLARLRGSSPALHRHLQLPVDSIGSVVRYVDAQMSALFAYEASDTWLGISGGRNPATGPAARR